MCCKEQVNNYGGGTFVSCEENAEAGNQRESLTGARSGNAQIYEYLTLRRGCCTDQLSWSVQQPQIAFFLECLSSMV